MVAAPILSLMVLFLTAPTSALADNGNAPTTLSFFSSGQGAQAHWFNNEDQPPGDTDHQSIRLLTTNGAPTYEKGYAGILFHHVTGIPAAAFPDSSFWVKTRDFTGPSLGSPRLVVTFQTAAGGFVGYGSLRPEVLTPNWQLVSDVGNYPATGWDVMGGPCGFRYNTTWSEVQSCFAAFTTLSVYITTDAYGIDHLIDRIEVNGKRFSSASDNGNGRNEGAGPTATLDLTLLPPQPLPDLLPR